MTSKCTLCRKGYGGQKLYAIRIWKGGNKYHIRTAEAAFPPKIMSWEVGLKLIEDRKRHYPQTHYYLEPVNE